MQPERHLSKVRSSRPLSMAPSNSTRSCYQDCYSIDAPLQHDSVVSVLKLPPPALELTLEEVFTSDCVFVNSCNGLFLLCFSSDIIVLWNPTIRESRIIPSPISDANWGKSYYSLGHVSSFQDYKIVRVVRTRSDGYYVQIFSTKTDSWKLIGKLPRCNGFWGEIVVDDGFVYLITIEHDHEIIQCLDLKNEKFEEILYPDGADVLTVGENILAICSICINEMQDCKVWYCMEKNGMRSKWSKILAITYPIDFWNYICWTNPLAFSKDLDILILQDIDELIFNVYDSKRRKFVEVEVDGLELVKVDLHKGYYFSKYVTLAYVETLISPNAL
uniref:F-box protein CPR30-like n=1 Tax=Nicotiana tabacum TaxID=4097 RepID=A0A1S3XFU9_TOBAC|nr:PREDICTED: F-box protein CPR30-like [Nicotiana tabacum]